MDRQLLRRLMPILPENRALKPLHEPFHAEDAEKWRTRRQRFFCSPRPPRPPRETCSKDLNARRTMENEITRSRGEADKEARRALAGLHAPS